MLGYRTLVVGVAGKGKSGVRERENEPTVADAVSIGHISPDHHGDDRLAGRHALDHHAEPLACLILSPHSFGASLGDLLRPILRERRLHVHQALPENFG
jgi:hypothetical protein